MNRDEELKNISNKLSLLIAVHLRKGTEDMNKSELVELLSGFEVTNSDIANMIGIPKTSVEVLKSRNKKKGAKK